MLDTLRKPVYICGEYRIDVLRRRLYIDEQPLTVTAKAFDVLVELIKRPGEVVTKDELLDAVWPDTAVEENNLTQQISALRKLFNERVGEHKYIVTIPGRGYCFVAPVSELRSYTPREFLLAGSTTSSITIDISNSDREKPVGSLSFDAATLRGFAIAMAYVLIICLSPILFGGRSPATVDGKPQSVGVLTFRTFGVEDEWYGVGMRDTLRAKLGSLEDVAVRPLEADLPGSDTIALGRQLNIDVVLAGSIQREHDRIRVAVEIVDVRTERLVWGKTFDEDLSNLFELQDRIADEVVRNLRRPHRSGAAGRLDGLPLRASLTT